MKKNATNQRPEMVVKFHFGFLFTKKARTIRAHAYLTYKTDFFAKGCHDTNNLI